MAGGGILIFIAFLLITGGKAYYPAGVVPAELAAGAGPVLDWVFRGRLWRPVLVVGLILFSVGEHHTADAAGGSSRWTRVHDRDRAQSGSGGRGGMAGVRRSGRGGRGEHSRGAARRHHRVGSELSAGGGARCAPARERSDDARRVFRSQRLLVRGPPPESATDAIVIGNFSPAEPATGYGIPGKVADTVQTPPGVDNDLTGTPIHRCTGLRQPWSVLWPQAATFA